MRTVQRYLENPTFTPEVIIRDLAIGDIGWIIHRQGTLNADEFGWDGTYEALVAEILSDFVRRNDPRTERAWVAELNSSVVGSVFLVCATDKLAKNVLEKITMRRLLFAQ